MATLSPRFEAALALAFQLHNGQTRKATSVPYISHLLAVTSLVLEHGGDEDEAIAALLHDAVEDQGGATAREQIRQRFGERVAEIVDGCTDTDSTPKPPWRARKEAYIAHLPNASASVRLVSVADKVHNARSILSDYRQQGEALWRRFQGGKEGTLWYYRTLADTFRSLGPARLADELVKVVEEIEALVR